MKFSTSSLDLLKHLQIVSGAIGNNSILPILENFLFTIDDNQLNLAATDLETTITTSMEVKAKGSINVAIPAKMLLDTLKALPDQPIHFEIDEETFSIAITSDYGKYRMMGENGQDFPRIPLADDTQEVRMPSIDLNRAISKSIFAVSKDELRQSMTGANFLLEPQKITIAATDAHKLVKFELLELDHDVSTSFIVPKKALNLLKNGLPKEDEVVLSFNKTNAFFNFGKTNLVCRLIDAAYPNYESVIPTENPNKMVIDRADFLSSLKRLAIYANQSTNRVVLKINNNRLTLSTEDTDFLNEAKEVLSCAYEGSPLKIGFNAKFLMEMLSTLDSDEIKMEMSTPSQSGILQPVNDDDKENILMLLVSVFLNR